MIFEEQILTSWYLSFSGVTSGNLFYEVGLVYPNIEANPTENRAKGYKTQCLDDIYDVQNPNMLDIRATLELLDSWNTKLPIVLMSLRIGFLSQGM